MEEWNQLVSNFSLKGFEFKIIYILEAHARDGWPMPSSRYHPQGKVVALKNHTSLQERTDAARRLVEEMNVRGEVLIDDMKNTFNNEYGAWPTRFFVIKNGKLVFKGKNIDRFHILNGLLSITLF